MRAQAPTGDVAAGRARAGGSLARLCLHAVGVDLGLAIAATPGGRSERDTVTAITVAEASATVQAVPTIIAGDAALPAAQHAQRLRQVPPLKQYPPLGQLTQVCLQHSTLNASGKCRCSSSTRYQGSDAGLPAAQHAQRRMAGRLGRRQTHPGQPASQKASQKDYAWTRP